MNNNFRSKDWLNAIERENGAIVFEKGAKNIIGQRKTTSKKVNKKKNENCSEIGEN